MNANLNNQNKEAKECKELRVDIYVNKLVNGNHHQELLKFTKTEFTNLIIHSLKIIGRYVKNINTNQYYKKYFLVGLDPAKERVVYRSHESYDELILEKKLKEQRLKVWIDALAYNPDEYDKDDIDNFTNELLKSDNFPCLEKFTM